MEQLSDLRHLALHDIYFFEVNKQESLISKGWHIDIHRQAMASLSTYGPPAELDPLVYGH